MPLTLATLPWAPEPFSGIASGQTYRSPKQDRRSYGDSTSGPVLIALGPGTLGMGHQVWSEGINLRRADRGQGMCHSTEYDHLGADVDVVPFPSKPTRIVVSGDVPSYEVMDWERLVADAIERGPSGAHKDWTLTPKPTLRQRIRSAFRWTW